MPYAKISKPPAHANKNAGSSGDLANYLEKENIGLELSEKEFFFNQSDSNILVDEVVSGIDKNVKGLKKNETKFYEMSVSFSQNEIDHVKSLNPEVSDSKEAIRGYVRSVMDEYAQNFNRELKGKPLTGNDLVYYAKIEEGRRYHPDTHDEKTKDIYKHNFEVRQRINETPDQAKKDELSSQFLRNKEGAVILPGNPKPGDNTHVHIIISRRDASQSMSLSPQSNARNGHNILNGKKVKIGFDRDQFAEKVEKTFDNKFNYDRELNNMYRQRQIAKSLRNGHSKFAAFSRDPEKLAENMAKNMVGKMIRKGISTYLSSQGLGMLTPAIQSTIKTQGDQLVKLASKNLTKGIKDNMTKSVAQKGASKLAMKAMAAVPVPASMVINAITMAHATLSKGKEIVKDQSRD